MTVKTFETLTNGGVVLQGSPGKQYLIKRVMMRGLVTAADTVTQIGVKWSQLDYQAGPNAATTINLLYYPVVGQDATFERDWKDLNWLTKPGANVVGASVGDTLSVCYTLIEYEEVFTQ